MSTLTVKELSHPAGEVLKISAGKVLDLKSQGTVTMPTGSTIQVVSSTNTTAQSITATSWVDTNLSVAITPSSTSSKVKIEFSFIGINISLGTAGCSFRVLRDSTSLFTPVNNFSYFSSAAAGPYYGGYNDMVLDSPSTTSEVTYKIQVAGYNTTAVSLNYNSFFKDTIMATEIQG